MLGEDRLLLLSYKGRELDDISWKNLQIPHTYLLDNWPIKVTITYKYDVIFNYKKYSMCQSIVMEHS